jgi:radical SAM protein with 4Fe4S-binding SPASM domain
VARPVAEVRTVRYSLGSMDRHLLYNPASGSFAVTDSGGVRKVDDFFAGRCRSDAFIERLTGLRMFESVDASTGYGTAPERLIVELTSACNLRCRTCYMSAAAPREKELTSEEVRDLLQEASDGGTTTVALTGGEPFMKSDLGDLVEFALERFSDVQVSTNGTMIDHAFLERFDHATGLSMQVSLDGPDDASNDAIRGSGNFRKASEFLDMVRAHGIRTSMSGVLNKHNYNLVGDMCDFAFRKDCAIAIFHKIHLSGRAEHSREILPSKAELMHGMGVLLNKLHEYQSAGTLLVDFPLNRFLRGDPSLDAAYPACHFGRAFAFVTSDGELVCCSHLRDGEFAYGNVTQAGLMRLWESSQGLERMRRLTVDDMPACSQCRYKYVCRGSCRADALGTTGDLTGQPYDCEALAAYYDYVFEHIARTMEPILPEEA